MYILCIERINKFYKIFLQKNILTSKICWKPEKIWKRPEWETYLNITCSKPSRYRCNNDVTTALAWGTQCDDLVGRLPFASQQTVSACNFSTLEMFHKICTMMVHFHHCTLIFVFYGFFTFWAFRSRWIWRSKLTRLYTNARPTTLSLNRHLNKFNLLAFASDHLTGNGKTLINICFGLNGQGSIYCFEGS